MEMDGSTTRWRYDVFLSFRGKDTRKRFTDHLYTALVREGIHTFRDDDEIESGGEIGPECLKAIRESRISIVVLSEGYATSSWCLDELVHILECRKTLGHIVRPIFYDVDPSHVEEIKGSFEEGFTDHLKNYSEATVEKWKAALREVSYLKGLDLPNHADGHEAKNINNIVKEISTMLGRTKLNVATHPVDPLHSHASKVISLLVPKSTDGVRKNKSVDIRIVGIYGMGGIGKTTVAKQVYNQLFHKFEGCCSFLENVRQKFELVKQNIDLKAITRMQRQLLSNVLKRKHDKIDNADRGLNLIKERLRHKRVLIVLDDIDKMDQINKILGNFDWLSSKSKVIITTRIKNLLPLSESYWQYEVKEMDHHHSLQLLSLHAFNKSHPPSEFMDCAKRVVEYAGGIPLALEVLGSSLNGEGIDVWTRRLDKLKVISNEDIHSKLETSYNTLDDIEKSLFLDIACFFVGKGKYFVITISDDLFPVDAIHSLLKRCLVKLDFHNKLLMHDLIRDMGREIVRRESPKYPGKRSRLWRHQDAVDILAYDSGTDVVEGLIVNLPENEHSSTEAFKDMTSLRLLQLNYVSLKGSYQHISKQLCWLCWHKFPLKVMPSELHLKNLMALDLRYSSLKQFSEDTKSLKKLKILNLSHSHELIHTPNFEGFSSLQKLMLKDCPSLVDVHESIGQLTQLIFLNLQDCKMLESLPGSICDLSSLENLNLSGCWRLSELPENFENLNSLITLLADETAIRTLPPSIGNLKKLQTFSLRDCHLFSLQRKSPFSNNFLPSSLRTLDLRNCRISDDLIAINFQGLLFLEDVKLCGNNFTSLPVDIGTLPKLQTLWLNNCKRLQSIPQLNSSLKSLQANDCLSLESIKLANFVLDPGLELRGCPSLREVEGFFNFEPLKAETLEELLKISSNSFTQDYVANVQVHMINNLTETYRICPLQTLCERGIYSVFLPGRTIPLWISHQNNRGNTVSLHVPSLNQGTRIIGIATSVIYAWRSSESCYFAPHITLTNRTKMFNWMYSPFVTFFSSEVEQDIMWLSYWMFDNLLEDRRDIDMNWRFRHEMEEGDEVEFLVDMGFGITIKKCGIHLFYSQQIDNNNFLEPSHRHLALVADASSRHQTRFSTSRPKWLTKDYKRFSKSRHEWLATRHQMITPHDKHTWRPSNNADLLFHHPNQAENEERDYTRWSKQRAQILNNTPTLYESMQKSSKSRIVQSNLVKSKSEKSVMESRKKNGSTLAGVTNKEMATDDVMEHLHLVENKQIIVQPTAMGGTRIASSSRQLESSKVALSSFTVTLSDPITSSKILNPLGPCLQCLESNMTASRVFDPQSFSNVQMKSKRLLTQLHNRIKTRKSPMIAATSSTSSIAPSPDFLQQQRKCLADFLNMSVEAIQQANAFEDVKRMALSIIQYTNDSREKIGLEDLISHLTEFKDNIPSAMAMAEAARTNKETLQKRSKVVDDRLQTMQVARGLLEGELSKLSEEEMQIEAEIQLLESRKEQVMFRKASVASELENSSEEIYKDLEEWTNLEQETKQAEEDWLQANQKLGNANARLKLMKQKLIL